MNAWLLVWLCDCDGDARVLRDWDCVDESEGEREGVAVVDGVWLGVATCDRLALGLCVSLGDCVTDGEGLGLRETDNVCVAVEVMLGVAEAEGVCENE